jgi:hypothetical protein
MKGRQTTLNVIVALLLVLTSFYADRALAGGGIPDCIRLR